MKHISKEDYILWDMVKNEPVEGWDIVYHYTSIIEYVNIDGFEVSEGQELICVNELSLHFKREISLAIELTK
tara:strand:- start:106 stop:321 length:216 start_codon:yes stop_codon:yes gene_type:complete